MNTLTLDALYASLPEQFATINIFGEILAQDEAAEGVSTLEQLLEYYEIIRESDILIEEFLSEYVKTDEYKIKRLAKIEEAEADKNFDVDKVDMLLVGEILEPIVDERVLTLNINSPGGSMDEGFAIIGTLNRLKEHDVYIETNAIGIAMSMAVPIFVTGDRRIASKYSVFMFHASKVAMPFATSASHEKFIELLQIGKDHIKDIFSHTAIVDKIDKYWTDEPHFFTAQQMLEEGVVESIY